MINVVICGANGMMGQVLADAIKKSAVLVVSAGVDFFPEARKNEFPVYKSISDCEQAPDVLIDFSRPEALGANLEFAIARDVPIVIATTGFSDKDKVQIANAAKQIPIFFAANMSLGVNLQMELCKYAAEFLGEAYDIEIVEKHHNQKVDSPSGTALAIAEHINDAFVDKKEFVYGRHTKTQKRGREIGIHGVRGGTIVGEHSVLFIGTDEVIEVKHTAQSKQVFASGAIRAAAFLAAKPAGLYNMSDMIGQHPVTNIHETQAQAMITLSMLPYSPATLASIFSDIADSGIKIDMISQTAPMDGVIGLSFTMRSDDLDSCLSLLSKYEIDAVKLTPNERLTKLTIEGSGMERQSGVAYRMFSALAIVDIGIYIVTTSETMIEFCVDDESVDAAIKAVTDAFSL